MVSSTKENNAKNRQQNATVCITPMILTRLLVFPVTDEASLKLEIYKSGSVVRGPVHAKDDNGENTSQIYKPSEEDSL